MLRKRIIEIDVAGGLDTKRDAKLLPNGLLSGLTNGVFDQGDVIRKRNGYVALPNTTVDGNEITSGDGVLRFGEELLALSDNKLFSFLSGPQKWVERSALSAIQLSKARVLRNAHEQSGVDHAVLDGMALTCWEDGRGGVRAMVQDLETGATAVPDTELDGGGELPRAVTINRTLWVFYGNGANLKARAVKADFSGFESAVTTVSDLDSANVLFDIVRIGTNAILAYRDSGGDINVAYVLEDGSEGGVVDNVAAPTQYTTEEAADALALVVNSDANRIYMAWSNTTDGIEVMSLHTGLTQELSTTTIEATSTTIEAIGMAEDADGNIQVYWQHDAASAANHLVKTCTVAATPSVGSVSVFARGVGLIGRPFLQGSVVHVPVAHESPLQSTGFLLDGDGGVQARFLDGVAGGLLSSARTASAVQHDGAWILPVLEKTEKQSRGGGVYTVVGVSRVRFAFGAAGGLGSAEVGDGLLIGGGVVRLYDGASVTEQGFHWFPEGVSATASATGGSIADGAYQYSVLYEWIDNAGKPHFSEPTAGLDVEVPGSANTGSVTLTIPTLRLTDKAAVKCVVYRNEGLGGDVFYRLGDVDNDTTVDTVQYTDTTADADLLGREILYTGNGEGELANRPPPAGTLMAEYKNRPWLVDGLSLRFGKRAGPGVSAQFVPEFRVAVDGEGGDITAIKAMDDKLVIFKARRLFVLTGEGPLPTGQGSAYPEPTLVTSDVGCINSRSVVDTPVGLMFKSAKGIYLLGRDLGVSYIGAPVEEYNNLSITGADVAPGGNQVRFLSSSGVCQMYDYFYKKWSTFDNHEGAGSAVWDGSYVYLRNNGQVYRERAGLYTDDAARISRTIETHNIKVGSLQDMQRVFFVTLIGEYLSAHVLQVEAAYDYSPSYEDPVTYEYANTVFGDEDSTFGDENEVFGGDDGVYQVRIDLGGVRCQAVRFRIRDLQPVADGGAFTLAGLQLEIGVDSRTPVTPTRATAAA